MTLTSTLPGQRSALRTRELTPWRRLTTRWWVCLEWTLADLWTGMYWSHEWVEVENQLVAGIRYLNVYVCLVPTMPLHFQRTVLVRREEVKA